MKSERALAAYVRRSNAIEGIRTGLRAPQYRHHLDAARYVAALPRKVLLTPDAIHTRIMPGLLAPPYVGRYRTVIEVRVGATPMPRARTVKRLMSELEVLVKKVIEHQRRRALTREDLELLLDYCFYRGLIIHPFVDGNGRTFRLYLNHLRQQCGLPWRQYRECGQEWVRMLLRLRHHEKLFKRSCWRCYRPTPPA